MVRTPWLVMAAALSWAAAWSCTEARGAEGDDTSPEAGAEERRRQAIEVLLTGRPDERLEVAGDLPRFLHLSYSLDDAPAPALEELTDELIVVLHQEADDWIARTLLESLLRRNNPAFNRLFREALDSRSVNVQSVGVRASRRRGVAEAVPALEALWEHDIPRWLRVQLLDALAIRGSTTYLDDFTRLTRSDDPGLRRASIDALATLGRDESIPALVRSIHEGTSADRRSAIEALGSFPDSEAALQEVLRASRTLDVPELQSAIPALGLFPQMDAAARLIALLGAPPDPELRGPIASALESSTHPDATSALVRLLHQPDLAPDSWIALSAFAALRTRDDPDAVAGLRDLQTPPIDGTRDALDSLVQFLSRDRSSDRSSAPVRLGHRLGPISPREPQHDHVIPPEPFETIRCWDAPDRTGDPQNRPRLRAGTLVDVVDYFERPKVTWVRLEGEGVYWCWVPLDQLGNGGAAREPASWPRHHVRVEVDLDAEDVASSRAGLLEAAGILSVFDPGEEVAGVALTLDATDDHQVALVSALASRADTPFDMALRSLLSQGLDAAVPGERTDSGGDDSEEAGGNSP